MQERNFYYNLPQHPAEGRLQLSHHSGFLGVILLVDFPSKHGQQDLVEDNLE